MSASNDCAFETGGAAANMAMPKVAVNPALKMLQTTSVATDRPWYWEGNVQARIVEFLKSQGASVHASTDTASREQGKDIVAVDPEGQTIWITVKGFPEKSRNVQTRHWFAGALLDLARYRDKSRNACFGDGLTVWVSNLRSPAEADQCGTAILGLCGLLGQGRRNGDARRSRRSSMIALYGRFA